MTWCQFNKEEEGKEFCGKSSRWEIICIQSASIWSSVQRIFNDLAQIDSGFGWLPSKGKDNKKLIQVVFYKKKFTKGWTTYRLFLKNC